LPNNRRKSLTKSRRYAILARDGFQCRYCGAAADNTVLVVDHIIPVALGGTNDPENLITACEVCNQGKAAKTPTTAAPTETDRKRLEESVRRQEDAARLVAEAAESRKNLRQELCNAWCEIRNTESITSATLRSLLHWHSEVGPKRLVNWITIAQERKPDWSDFNLCRYIGGIRKREYENELKAEARADDRRWRGPVDGVYREATTDDR
jgi:hypothetical protein